MNKKTKNNLKKKAVNFLGAIGYFFSSLQWLWVLLIYSSLITGLAKIMSHGTTKQVTTPSANIDLGSSIPMIIITFVITFIMVVLTVYIIIKIPTTLAKASKKVVQGAAENATTLVLQAQNKKNTKKNHIKMTPKLVLIMKIILVLVPIIFVFNSQFIEKQIFDFFIAMYIGGLLACFSLLFFVFQYLAAELMSVKKQDIW
jgi:hypothetical protein